SPTSRVDRGQMPASCTAQRPIRVEKRPSVETNMRLLSPKERLMDASTKTTGCVTPWNKGKLLGQKPPLKLRETWAIRIRLQLDHRTREVALFNLAIDSKLRGCDLVALRVHDVVQGSRVASRAIVMHSDQCNMRSPSKRLMW